MNKGRLEAFSDGVLAIILTIMVLELRPPHGDDLAALCTLAPALLSYVLSFIYVGIYWNNHHHMLQATRRINGSIMWRNLLLLFFLSLVPAITAWVGEHPFSSLPAAIYGLVLLSAGLSYTFLQTAIVCDNGHDSPLAKAVGRDWKGKASAVLYTSAIGLSFVRPWIADIIYAGVAAMWLVPDPRIEKNILDESRAAEGGSE